jgi:heme-degrading monooxygenase HmoA
MVVTVFRYTPNPAFDAEATPLGERMYELALQAPGFISFKEFAAPDGEVVAIVEFETEAHVRAFGAHPEHRAAQERGRRALFTHYSVQVCEVLRSSASPRRP